MSVAEVTEIPLPRLSDSMEEGTIVRWFRATGDRIAPGEALVEIETDKATMEYEAEEGGVVEVLVAAGETVPLGAPIARLLPEASATAPVAAVGARNGERVLATPVARRMARELGVELAAVAASGRRGQIVKADVEAHAARGGNGAPAAAMPTAPAVAARDAAAAVPLPDTTSSDWSAGRHEPLSRMQRTVARRMSQSRTVVPEFEVEVDIDMGACLELRAQLAGHLDPVPSINDMIVRACALALRAHPRVNGTYRDDSIELHDAINVGIAVAGEDALMVAVVHDADRTPLSEIAVRTCRLAERARSGEITPAEVTGATFTVSNLGMFGADRFTAIIDMPQAAILAVGAVADRPVVSGGEVVPGKVMSATLASDHRIIYGADAARFVCAVRDLLQAPIRLLS